MARIASTTSAKPAATCGLSLWPISLSVEVHELAYKHDLWLLASHVYCDMTWGLTYHRDIFLARKVSSGYFHIGQWFTRK